MTDWLILLGDSLRLQEKWDAAEIAYLQALERETNWRSLIGLGWVYYGQGKDVQVSIDLFMKAASLNSSNGDAYYSIGKLLVIEGRYSEADSWFERAINASPDNPSFYIAQANAARSAGKMDQALRMYNNTISLFPSCTQAYCEMAWAYKLNDQPQLAVDAIEKAHEIAGEELMPWCHLYSGWIFAWIGDYEKAIYEYWQVLIFDPNNTSALDGIKHLENK